MKVIQLQAIAHNLFQIGGLYALCDDGSIHYITMKGKPKWRQIPTPQDQKDAFEKQS